MPNPTWMTADLEQFLNAAYQEAWPKNVSKIADGSRFNGFEEVRYDDEPWSYVDVFFGSVNDAGIEVVKYKSTPVWSNVYRGGLTVDFHTHDVFAFLIQALDAPASSTTYRPRGPAIFEVDGIPLVYRYTGHGNLTRFFGVEIITHDQDILYERTVAGGLIGADLVPLTTEYSAVLAGVHRK